MGAKLFPELAFVDIETTGSNFERDRITEIGIAFIDSESESDFSLLIDPEVSIPKNIQVLTGINNAMVAGQSTFEEVAHTLYEILKDKLFIAHNARFDYGFLRASFKRVGIDFRPKVLCTVKLSRLLFPEQSRHNLDTLIKIHELKVSQRHRALGDANLLKQFWLKCLTQFGNDELKGAIDQIIGSSTLPPNIDPAMVEEVPEKPGCYIFYGENKLPLYIGKSINMRARVMSHFQSAISQRKSMKLSLQVRSIDWVETQGELGALLLESTLIKNLMPTLNIKLRRSKDLCAWQLRENSNGYLVPHLVSHRELNPGIQANLYGAFHSKRDATNYLRTIAKKHQLCEGLLGLERHLDNQPCFGYQLKRCSGACINKISINEFNNTLLKSFNSSLIQIWPYGGPIGIREGRSIIVIDRWRYLGTAYDEAELAELIAEGESEFDLDHYKILKQALKKIPASRLIKLKNRYEDSNLLV